MDWSLRTHGFAAAALALVFFSRTSGAAPVRQEISKSEPKPTIHVDVFGDALPVGAVARMGSARLHHRGNLQSLTFAPEAALLGSTDDRGTIYLWDTSAGKAV